MFNTLRPHRAQFLCLLYINQERVVHPKEPRRQAPVIRPIADLNAKEEHLCTFDVARKGECVNGGGHEDVVVEFDPFFELLVEIDEADAVGEVPGKPARVGVCVGFGKALGVVGVGVTPYFMTLRSIQSEVSG